jgi:hypothetical protein
MAISFWPHSDTSEPVSQRDSSLLSDQLAKVIQLFQCQVSERQFQVEQLHSHLDRQINVNLPAYEAKIGAVQQSANSQRNDLFQAAANFYKRKSAQLIDDCSQFVQSQNSALEQFQSKVADDVALLTRQLKTLTKTLENNAVAVDLARFTPEKLT